MENIRLIKILGVLLGGGIAFSIPLFVFGYDDKTTHPALTKEISRFFNISYHMSYPELALDSQEIQILMQGSIDEDEEFRWMRHFYDPVYNRGLVLLGDTWESSKDWSQDTLAQATEDGAFRDKTYGSIFSLFSSSSDYSWERAVYEYAWKDKNRGLEALGHILHLLEDATVPDHTRNDPHAGFFEHWQVLNSSPYEDWTRKFNPENLDFADLLISESQKSLNLETISGYFDKTANYSNNNFFSRDTILSEDYDKPVPVYYKTEKLNNGIYYTFAYAEDNHKLFRTDKELSWTDLVRDQDDATIYLQDNDNLILTDYWNLLSKQAVINGAGVVKLFFDEVEKEKQTRELWLKNRSWWQKAWGWATSIFSEVGLPDGSPTSTDYTAGIVGSMGSTDLSTSDDATAVAASDVSTTESTPDDALGAASGVSTTLTPDDATAVATSDVYDSSTPSDAGVPAVLGVSTTTISTPDDAEASAASGVTATTPAPPFIPPMIAGGGGDYIPPVQTESTSGDAEASAALDVSTTTTSTSDDSDASAASDVSTTTIDTTPPDISLTIQECSGSFSQTGCVVATTTLTILLESNAEDLESFILNCQFRNRLSQPWQDCGGFPKTIEVGLPAGSPTSTTTATSTPSDAEASAALGVATSTVFIAAHNTFYEFRAKARDVNGNESQEVIKSVEINPTPIIINEIAWAGTGASATTSEQEWLELYNRSNSEIDLNGWQLKFFRPNVEEPETTIELSGKIAPKDYYLIERDTNETIANLKADLVTSFGGGLADEGMILKLERGPTTMDRTPELCAINNPWTFGWCGGSAVSRASSERVEPDAAGESQANWETYLEEEAVRPYKSSEGAEIFGTPKSRNSQNYLIVGYEGQLTQDKTLTKENSPYIITRRDGLNIQAGATLTIEPGVVIKIVPPYFWILAGIKQINVSGKIIARGTAEEPVVITTIFDDEFGGDTNKDGVCDAQNASSSARCPEAGDWHRIIFSPESSGSELTNTFIRYGGNLDNNVQQERRVMVYIDGANAEIKNSRIEFSKERGLTCINCDAEISDSVFYKNGNEALIIAGSAPKILNNTFLENGKGIFASDIHGGEVRNNTFDKNGNVIIAESSPPLFGGNTVTDDSPGVKGIILRNGVGGDYSFAKDLSYVIEWGNYSFNGNIVAEKGAVFKFMTNPSTGLTIAGAFTAKGTPEEPVVFTSFYDDEFGGDTSNDATSSQPALGHWSGINFWGEKESILDGVVVRYAGGQNWWYNLAGIKAGGQAPLIIKNSVIEKNKFRGVWVSGNASTTIMDTVFRDNHHPEEGGVYPYALLVSDNGTTTISNLIFRNNDIGIGTGSEYHIINNGEIDIDDSNITKTIPEDLLP